MHAASFARVLVCLGLPVAAVGCRAEPASSARDGSSAPAKIAIVVFDNVRVQATTGMQVFHATGVSFVNGSAVTPRSGAAVTTFDATVSGIATTPR